MGYLIFSHLCFISIHFRNSEDDPERLWCICQQPHNNRFMICCDSCVDWYHGKCVGITKKMGQEMEDAGNEWRCPKCKRKEKADASTEVKHDLEQKLEAKVQRENNRQLQQEKRLAPSMSGSKKKSKTGLPKRPGSAMSNDGKDEKVNMIGWLCDGGQAINLIRGAILALNIFAYFLETEGKNLFRMWQVTKGRIYFLF